MSPEAHERAVEIFETKNGMEYSDHVENTPEWADAVEEAIDTLPDENAADLCFSCASTQTQGQR